MGRSSPRVKFRSALTGSAFQSMVAVFALIAASLWMLAPSTSATAAASVSPLTASGCNQRVCIYVEGSGTSVTYWSTTATLPASMCTVASYCANGVLVYKGNAKCGSSGEVCPRTGRVPATSPSARSFVTAGRESWGSPARRSNK